MASCRSAPILPSLEVPVIALTSIVIIWLPETEQCSVRLQSRFGLDRSFSAIAFTCFVSPPPAVPVSLNVLRVAWVAPGVLLRVETGKRTACAPDSALFACHIGTKILFRPPFEVTISSVTRLTALKLIRWLSVRTETEICSPGWISCN